MYHTRTADPIWKTKPRNFLITGNRTPTRLYDTIMIIMQLQLQWGRHGCHITYLTVAQYNCYLPWSLALVLANVCSNRHSQQTGTEQHQWMSQTWSGIMFVIIAMMMIEKNIANFKHEKFNHNYNQQQNFKVSCFIHQQSDSWLSTLPKPFNNYQITVWVWVYKSTTENPCQHVCRSVNSVSCLASTVHTILALNRWSWNCTGRGAALNLTWGCGICIGAWSSGSKALVNSIAISDSESDSVINRFKTYDVWSEYQIIWVWLVISF